MSPYQVALSSLFVLAACDLGDVRDQGSTGNPDADVADPGADASPQVACRDTVPNVGGGEHNPGQACIACHAADDGPAFTLAGTLYGDLAGAAPIAGVTIIVTDADGATVDMVTQQNGNFWTSEPMTFPVHVAASACPDTVPMAGAIVTAGDCNAGGCHSAGSATGRIHLP